MILDLETGSQSNVIVSLDSIQSILYLVHVCLLKPHFQMTFHVSTLPKLKIKIGFEVSRIMSGKL